MFVIAHTESQSTAPVHRYTGLQRCSAGRRARARGAQLGGRPPPHGRQGAGGLRNPARRDDAGLVRRHLPGRRAAPPRPGSGTGAGGRGRLARGAGAAHRHPGAVPGAGAHGGCRHRGCARHPHGGHRRAGRAADRGRPAPGGEEAAAAVGRAPARLVRPLLRHARRPSSTASSLATTARSAPARRTPSSIASSARWRARPTRTRRGGWRRRSTATASSSPKRSSSARPRRCTRSTVTSTSRPT